MLSKTIIHVQRYPHPHTSPHTSTPIYIYTNPLSHTYIYPHTYTHMPHTLIYLHIHTYTTYTHIPTPTHTPLHIHPAYTANNSQNTHIFSMHIVTYTPYIHIHSHTYYTQHKHTKCSTETHNCATKTCQEKPEPQRLCGTLGCWLCPRSLQGPSPHSCWGHPLCTMCEESPAAMWSGKGTEKSKTVEEPSWSSYSPIPLWGLSGYKTRQPGTGTGRVRCR